MRCSSCLEPRPACLAEALHCVLALCASHPNIASLGSACVEPLNSVPASSWPRQPASFTHWPSDWEGPSFGHGETSWLALRAHVVCVPFDVARWACVELLKSPFGLGRLLHSSLAAWWSAGCFRAASDSDLIVRAVPGQPAMESVHVSEWPTTPLVQVGTAFVVVRWACVKAACFVRVWPLGGLAASEPRPIRSLAPFLRLG